MATVFNIGAYVLMVLGALVVMGITVFSWVLCVWGDGGVLDVRGTTSEKVKWTVVVFVSTVLTVGSGYAFVQHMQSRPAAQTVTFVCDPAT